MSESDPNPFETHLDPNPANYAALTPLGFLDRAASVYPDRVSVINGEARYRWAETRERCRRLASALRRSGIEEGDTYPFSPRTCPRSTRRASRSRWRARC